MRILPSNPFSRIEGSAIIDLIDIDKNYIASCLQTRTEFIACLRGTEINNQEDAEYLAMAFCFDSRPTIGEDFYARFSSKNLGEEFLLNYFVNHKKYIKLTEEQSLLL